MSYFTRISVLGQVGLQVTSLEFVAEGYKANACRRNHLGPAGHEWRVYRAQAESFDLHPSERETRNAWWSTRQEIQSLAERTKRYLSKQISDEEWEADPGLEPVWYEWFVEIGIVKSDLAIILDRMTSKTPPPLVTYCGSTSKCQQQFRRVQLYDTIRPEPRMFFTIGCTMMSDAQLVQVGVRLDKDALDELHFWKIHTTARLAQQFGIVGEVCILDLTDAGTMYLGESTKRELEYARKLIHQGYPLTLRFWSQEQEQVQEILRDVVQEAAA